MTQTKTNVEVVQSATHDGYVSLVVSKLWTGGDFKAFSHTLNTGVSCETLGPLVINVPVEDCKEGVSITIEQAAALLQAQLSIVLPAAKVFVEGAQNDFQPEEASF